MRPTNLCHLYDLRVPVPRSFPAHFRGFHRVDTPRSLGSVQHDRGTKCFTTPEPALADRTKTRASLRLASLAPVMRLVRERGRFLPTAPSSIEPLTSLSPPLLPPGAGTPSRSFTSFCFRFSSPTLREETAEIAVTNLS
jgi:hypothetical protein